MFSPFSCATFNHHEDDDEPMIANQVSSPSRKSSRSKSSSKNPYSTLGLDKYSALVAELEEKRRKIYAQTDPKDISFVRFVYKDLTDTGADPVPIVVRLKDKKEENKTKTAVDHQELKEQHVTHNSDALVTDIDRSSKSPKEAKQQPEKESKNKALSCWKMKLDKWRRPAYYLPAVIIFILVLLVFFGRSFAILCVSIVWYAIPTLKESSNHTRRGSKKKDYVRRLSDNKMVISEGFMSSPTRNNVMGKHGHQKNL